MRDSDRGTIDVHKRMTNEYKDKKILVTGGTGSIGSEIVRQLLEKDPAQIRIYARDEGKHASLMREIGTDERLRYLIGDIRDKERLMLAMEGVDIVFHAAAMKHVDICERNPFEAVKTNVGGTQNVIDCAFAHNVEKVVGISTDKAANPTNVMGTTKLLAEKLMLSSFFYKGDKRTTFSCVRFGNVLWSRGSVLPHFVEQIRRGEPITLTDPSMTRFFLSIPQAVSLVFRAASMMQEREIFVLKMPAARMGDIVAALEEILRKDRTILLPHPVSIVGAKEGERTHEKLLTEEESENALETNDMYIILPNYTSGPARPQLSYPKAKKAKYGEFTSETTKLLSIPEIRDMLSEGETRSILGL